MTINPTNFIEASLAEQIFAEENETETVAWFPAMASKRHEPLKWDDLLGQDKVVATATEESRS